MTKTGISRCLLTTSIIVWILGSAFSAFMVVLVFSGGSFTRFDFADNTHRARKDILEIALLVSVMPAALLWVSARVRRAELYTLSSFLSGGVLVFFFMFKYFLAAGLIPF